ncbi:Transferase [Sesbania bispinosa]|nr:Transferase [Sesbania bispinosa]
MKVEVELVSKEIVKPSSPTPTHLHHYNLSFLDQLTPQLNNAMVYFFTAGDLSDLKNSLSQALTHYYPLAGRFVDNTFIECNDHGVPYLEARVPCKVKDIVDNPIPNEISKLLPFEMDEIVDTPLGVQLNFFDCGGIALGVCMSHKIADAMSYFVFIQTWAAIARGEANDIKKHFISANLFPPRDISWYDPNRAIAKENIVSKMFVFDASVIDALKVKYAERLNLEKPPSRVEALSTFIWTRFVANSERSQSQSQRTYLVAYTVNLRSRMDPPLPAYAFGNYYRGVKTFPSLDDKGECYDMVGELRKEIKKIDNDYIRRLQEGSEYLNSLKEDLSRLMKNRDNIVPFTFSALCRFPVYDADFGWGKPIWVGPPGWKVKNVVIFKDTKSGGGIEAYITMTEEDMVRFQNDKDLLAHISNIQQLN